MKKKTNLTAILTWRGEVRHTSTDILGTPSMGKAMELWRRWMIIGMEPCCAIRRLVT